MSDSEIVKIDLSVSDKLLDEMIAYPDYGFAAHMAFVELKHWRELNRKRSSEIVRKVMRHE